MTDVIGAALEEECGVTLNRVPLTDTADAVNLILSEKEAGVTGRGDMDLVWINRANFRTMKQGGLTALLCPSVCGKTTEMKLTCGLLAPERGRILFVGQDVIGIPSEERGAATVFHNQVLFPHVSVADNVSFGP